MSERFFPGPSVSMRVSVRRDINVVASNARARLCRAVVLPVRRTRAVHANARLLAARENDRKLIGARQNSVSEILSAATVQRASRATSVADLRVAPPYCLAGESVDPAVARGAYAAAASGSTVRVINILADSRAPHNTVVGIKLLLLLFLLMRLCILVLCVRVCVPAHACTLYIRK